jgi:hypothetical protein
VGEVLTHDPNAGAYRPFSSISSHWSRRPDVILLIGGAVLVLEFKGKSRAELADLDQASAYAGLARLPLNAQTTR